MPVWTRGFLKYKDEDGAEKQVVAWVSDDATAQHLPAGVLLDPADGNPFSASKPLPAQLRSSAGVEFTALVGPIPDFTADSGLVVAIAGMLGNNTTTGGTLHALPAAAYRNPTTPDADGKVGVLALDSAGDLRVAVRSDLGLFAEDAAHASGDKGRMALAVRKDVAGTFASADGDYTPLQVDDTGALRVTGGAGGSAGTEYTEGDTDATITGQALLWEDASDTLRPVSAATPLPTLPAFKTPAGDTMVDDTAGIDGLQVTLMTMAQVIGSVAHDGVDTQPPVKVGGRANSTLRTAVANDDRVDALFDLEGAIVARRADANAFVDGNASNTDGTSTQVIAAGAAGVRTYLCDVEVTNTHASQFAYVEIKDGTTVRATLPVPPSGGVVKHFDPPLRGTAATAWNFDPSAATTTLICSMSGYQSKA